jgi:hypothetical protein
LAAMDDSDPEWVDSDAPRWHQLQVTLRFIP